MTGPAGERIQKVLAGSGMCSRRAADELVRAGRVTVNGATCVLGQRVDPTRDAIKVDGRRLAVPAAAARRHRHLLLNKPRGYVTTLSDPEGRDTVLDLVPPRLRRGLVPVGRLDYHTEGLLLLTSDGELAHRLTHPRYGCVKTYEVKVKGEPDDRAVERLRRGVALHGKRTLPCRVKRLPRPRGPRAAEASSWWQIELGEGRTRQVREMFQAVGHPVERLRRVAIGPVRDPDLPSGACRELRER